jgi:hypothetical protein
MDKASEQALHELFRRAGLELSEQDRERFMPMLDAYLNSVEHLHSINLSDEETAPVFRPETSEE